MASLTATAPPAPDPCALQAEVIAATSTVDAQPAGRRPLPEGHRAKLLPASLELPGEGPRRPSRQAGTRMAPLLLTAGTVVELKTCRHCIEKWIATRREYELRGMRRDPAVPCSHEHLQGVVQLYDMQYSRGAFPVLFTDGISRQAMAEDVWVITPPTVERSAATVVKIRPRPVRAKVVATPPLIA